MDAGDWPCRLGSVSDPGGRDGISGLPGRGAGGVWARSRDVRLQLDAGAVPDRACADAIDGLRTDEHDGHLFGRRGGGGGRGAKGNGGDRRDAAGGGRDSARVCDRACAVTAQRGSASGLKASRAAADPGILYRMGRMRRPCRVSAYARQSSAPDLKKPS